MEICYKRRRRLQEREKSIAKNAAERWRGNIERKKVRREGEYREEEDKKWRRNIERKKGCYGRYFWMLRDIDGEGKK